MVDKTYDQREDLYQAQQQQARLYNQERQAEKARGASLPKTGLGYIDEQERTKLIQGWKRYELLRTLNPRQFQVLWDRCLERDLKFDDVVDEMMGEKA